MVRSRSLQWRNKAAYTELLTPLRLKVGVVLMKRQADKKRVPAGLIVELALAYGYNSRTIRRRLPGPNFYAWSFRLTALLSGQVREAL